MLLKFNARKGKKRKEKKFKARLQTRNGKVEVERNTSEHQLEETLINGSYKEYRLGEEKTLNSLLYLYVTSDHSFNLSAKQAIRVTTLITTKLLTIPDLVHHISYDDINHRI